jgi:hypothetical protein
MLLGLVRIGRRALGRLWIWSLVRLSRGSMHIIRVRGIRRHRMARVGGARNWWWRHAWRGQRFILRSILWFRSGSSRCGMLGIRRLVESWGLRLGLWSVWLRVWGARGDGRRLLLRDRRVDWRLRTMGLGGRWRCQRWKSIFGCRQLPRWVVV